MGAFVVCESRKYCSKQFPNVYGKESGIKVSWTNLNVAYY